MGATDTELIAEYAEKRSGTAFAELVERHSATVYSACLRVLGEAHAAEDATQAVFLVLARKSHALSGRRDLAGWLVVTARHVACRMLREEARRKAREKEAAKMAAVKQSGVLWEDVRPRLDAALAALPPAQRNAVVLRYMQNRPRAEGAREMGCTEESFSVTASRALARLRGLLARQGAAVPAAALGGLLAENAVQAVPAALVATLEGIGVGATTASATAASLAEGTMKAILMVKVKLAAVVIGVVAMVGTGGGLAVKHLAATGGEPAKVEAPASPSKAAPAADPYAKVRPELAPDKGLLAKIEALPDNTWLKLPPVKTAGERSWCGKPECPNSKKMLKFGPGLRDYSLKMVWAADRKRALYCGTNHGTFPITNDVWEYDLASNTWVCLFGSDPSVFNSSAEFYRKNAVLKDGVVQTPRGGILRPPHTWSGLTYDSHRHKMIWLLPRGGRGCTFVSMENLAKGLGFKNKDELNKAWRKGPWVNYKWAYTYWWTYDPYTGKGKMLTDGIPKGWEGDSLEYIPDQKKVWSSLGAQMYDPDRKVTVDPKPKGKAAGVGEVVAAYDPESKTIVMLSQNKTNTYSFATNEWKVVQDNAIASGVDMRSFFCYDLVARKFVLNTIDKGPKKDKKPGLYLYDLARNEWTKAEPRGDAAPDGGGGYYDPERNVTVKYTGREMYVYRCKKAGKIVK